MPKTRARLEAMHEDGVEVVIATGRRYRTTRFVIDNLGFDVYAVCNGGALVKDKDGTTLAETNFDAVHTQAIVDAARSAGVAIFGQRDAHSRDGADFVIDDGVPWSEAIQRYYTANEAWAARGDLDRHASEYLVKGAFGEEELLHRFAAQVARDLGDDFSTLVVPHHEYGCHYCEVTLTHVDKWHGLATLLETFGITAEQICTAGDQLNDIPMLEPAGHSFAMGNGNPVLSAHAKATCGAHDAEGLVDVVDYIEAFNARLGR